MAGCSYALVWQRPWKLHLPNLSTFSPIKCLKSSMARLHSSERWSQVIFSQVSQTLLAFLSQATLASFTAALALSKAFLAAWRPLVSSSAAFFDSSSKPVSIINLAWNPVPTNGFPYPAEIHTCALKTLNRLRFRSVSIRSFVRLKLTPVSNPKMFAAPWINI